MESRFDYLSKLPDEIIERIQVKIGHSASDIINLPQVSTRFVFFNRKDQYQLLLKNASDALRQLLSHAALSEWDKACAIWSDDPSLLTCRGTVYHPNRIYREGQDPLVISADKNPGRYKYVNHTAWQIAMMNEEYEIADEMGEFMKKDEMQSQFNEIFPDKELVKHNWDINEARILLKKVFDEVINDTSINTVNTNKTDIMHDSTRKALNELYAYVKPLPEHHAGLVFDARIYVDAVKLHDEYDDEHMKLRHCSMNPHHSLFWLIRVEEYLASLLGTAHLRQHAQGNNGSLKRKGCTLRDGSSYFLFRRKSDFIPGFHIFVNADGHGIGGMLSSHGTCAYQKNHFQLKQEQGLNLRNYIFSNKKHHRQRNVWK
jgi:hypothetical protein